MVKELNKVLNTRKCANSVIIQISDVSQFSLEFGIWNEFRNRLIIYLTHSFETNISKKSPLQLVATSVYYNTNRHLCRSWFLHNQFPCYYRSPRCCKNDPLPPLFLLPWVATSPFCHLIRTLLYTLLPLIPPQWLMCHPFRRQYHRTNIILLTFLWWGHIRSPAGGQIVVNIDGGEIRVLMKK